MVEYIYSPKQLTNPLTVNVKDFGAIGDGITNDQDAINDAFDYAVQHLPCEVYFPAGEYGILRGGITVYLPYSSGGLKIRGEGRDITTIKYLEDWVSSGTWYAIRVCPEGCPDNLPTDKSQYLHDISISDITVYDTDPVKHAWNTAKGDSGKEETHGFDIQFCKRCSVTNCNVIDVGDEAIDIYNCEDVIISNNHIQGSPGAGTAGGAISIGDGSLNVTISNNTINLTANDEILPIGTVLPTGTILAVDAVTETGTITAGTTLTEDITLTEEMVLVKNNFGIAVESLYVPVTNVTISGNNIYNIKGNGINLGATNTGASITNVTISNNTIDICINGIELMGAFVKDNIIISSNTITNCSKKGIISRTATYDVVIDSNIIKDVYNAIYLASISARYIVSNNSIMNTEAYAIMTSGDCIINNCIFKDIGISEVEDTIYGAIFKYQGTLKVCNTKLLNLHIKKGINGGIQNPNIVENTYIELYNDETNKINDGGYAIKGTDVCRVIGGDVGGRIEIGQPHSIVQGVKITSSNIGSNAIGINANYVSVIGCNVNINNYNSIKEKDGCDYNIFVNNIVNKTISTSGANTINDKNILYTTTA